MSNQTDPRCRDAFIAAREASDDYHNLIDAGRDLTDLEFEEYGEDGKCETLAGWDWIDEATAYVFAGFAMLWKPPSDVDPESVLGKLKELCVTPDTVFGNVLGGEIKMADIIETIETLQRERDAFKEEAVRQAKEKLMETRERIDTGERTNEH